MEFVNKQNNEHKMIFIKSWNEWAEGNYFEPDLEWGRGYLNAVKEIVQKYSA